ncbi:CDP-glycerol:poly(glycerophosphate) glycerophosphotransferase [Streptomyces sp. YIM 130001]|uniref:bifunctional glycosyltransferase/CDP-glycerol:glycerophosphate glycerophosphotransferase n=1 Tax=Streptomyces sp. YIM 130001 TaxID=2259644 RepID=UPI000E658EED|nr:bifunctional glycosyltransferase family 2 protein/CDP-glycerol:glycerophosphate glycerophosphotransferase [Streptomyces sp. YIM 130001]RII19848.1 CDP-glycerol:poly(glycerophosphate) glycerophosphotransferase [Streptomyces sp. YIM 130001]
MTTRDTAPPHEGPAFSCIVTCGPTGSADAVTATVRSVLGQTLRSVEAVLVAAEGEQDAPEGRDEAIAALAAEHPDRVRLVRADGPGTAALRNAGLDAAHGSHLLYLDAGELLQAHACRNLLDVARRTDADLVAGRWTRLTGSGRKQAGPDWQAELHARTRTLTAVTAAPELVVRDGGLASGYCLRRGFLDAHGLRHPVDAERADLVFGAMAALTAERLTLVPNVIVTRRAAPDHGRDFAGLVDAGTRIGRELADRGLGALHLAREQALAGDLLLPLAATFLRLSRDERHKLAQEVATHLNGVDQRWSELPPVERVCVRLLAAGDAEGVHAAAYALARPGTVVSPLVERDGRIHWSAEGLDDPEVRAGTDVSELGHQHRNLGTVQVMNRLTRCEPVDGALDLAGTLLLPLDVLPDTQEAVVRLEFKLRGSPRTFRMPVDETVRREGGFDWSVRVDPARLPARGMRERTWDARIVVEANGERLLAEVLAEPELTGPRAVFPARPRLGRLSADTWQPYTTARHHLALELKAERRPARTTRRILHYVTHFRPARTIRRFAKALRARRDRLNSGSVKTRVYNKILLKLPTRRNSAVFESHMGKCYGDSPRAIHEELNGQGLKVRSTWVYSTSQAGFPEDSKLVRRWSWRYLWALARAEFWIDNQGFPHALHKPSGTTYLQTWHGTAYKRMGFDETRVRMQNAPHRDRLQSAVDRFDRFLVRSEHDVRTLGNAYRIPASRLLPLGYPRNDRLVAARTREEAEGRFPRPALAAELGIPDHKTVILYAPTFRGVPKNGRKRQLDLDVRKFTETFGDRHTLLVRAHYMERAELPVCAPGTLIDVSDHHDVSELLCLADALVTDYSSIMFDYALLDRPVVLFAPDLDTYAAERGSYFDLRERAPGPLIETEGELLRVLADLKAIDTEHAERRRAFAAHFGAYDNGESARAVVDALFVRRTCK